MTKDVIDCHHIYFTHTHALTCNSKYFIRMCVCEQNCIAKYIKGMCKTLKNIKELNKYSVKIY